MQIQNNIIMLLSENTESKKVLGNSFTMDKPASLVSKVHSNNKVIFTANKLTPRNTFRQILSRLKNFSINRMRDIFAFNTCLLNHVLTKNTHRNRRNIRLPKPLQNILRGRLMIYRSPRSNRNSIKRRVIENPNIIKSQQPRRQFRILSLPMRIMQRHNISRILIHSPAVMRNQTRTSLNQAIDTFTTIIRKHRNLMAIPNKSFNDLLRLSTITSRLIKRV